MWKEAQADKQSQHLKNSPHLETLDDFAKTFLTLQTLLVRSNGNSCYSVPMDSEFSPSFPSNGSYIFQLNPAMLHIGVGEIDSVHSMSISQIR